MSARKALTIVLIVFGSGWCSVQASEAEIAGFLGISHRSFWQDKLLAAQDGGPSSSLQSQFEFYWRGNDRRSRVSVVAFGRLDSQDDDRSHVDLREASWTYSGDDWDFLIGVNKVFWGVAESRHLVDIINQADLVEDPDQEDKLGQPMVNLSVQRDWGRVGLFVLPYFRERTFAGVEGRLRTPLPVDAGRSTYASAQQRRHTDYALRYSHFIGNVDIGLHYFNGTSREPTFDLAADGRLLVPDYAQMQQLGLELQYTGDAWLWKLEAIRRDSRDDDFLAAVVGFEYTRFQVAGSSADIGILVEYLYDGRADYSPVTVFDDDWFIGLRLALNDVDDTSLLVGAIVDPTTDEYLLSMEAARRLGAGFRAEFRLRAFGGASMNEPLFPFKNDDYVEFEIARYF